MLKPRERARPDRHRVHQALPLTRLPSGEMSTNMNQSAASAFYDEQYAIIARFPFVARKPTWLADHADRSTQRCRFCRQTRPRVLFSNRAHAVPAFLGNKSLFTRNECNRCNKRLADEYDDHLSKWSLLARAAARIPARGKSRGPKYTDANQSVRIEPGDTGLDIHLLKDGLSNEIAGKKGPFEFILPTDGMSQPHVPLRAALALVRITCSICPAAELHQCERAIDWLMGRISVETSQFPVVCAFTPGPTQRDSGEAILLKRRCEDSTPYIWLIVRFANHQLQIHLPLCPADDHWFRAGETNELASPYYPSPFPDDWPFGATRYTLLDWSGTELVTPSMKVGMVLMPIRPHD